jgi:tRNA pseudouridine synthase 10
MSNQSQAKVFVEGRYRKLTRDLPQTVFFCPECKGHPRRRRNCEKCEGFGKLTRDSVQELVGWVLGKGFGTRKHKFHGAGREDVDVRMLGRGRPFILELINPSNPDADLAELEALVNSRNEGRLEISGLHWTEKARVRVIKEGKHAKRYGVHVSIEGEIDAQAKDALVGQRIVLAQRTPSRVAHRRADKIRERWIELESIEVLGDSALRVQLMTEHGTYVKEFISGEDGRTEPCLGSLLKGVTCGCVELDVLDILEAEGGEMAVDPGWEAPAAFGTGLDQASS